MESAFRLGLAAYLWHKTRAPGELVFITLESIYKNDKRSFCMYRILKDVSETLELLFAIFMSIELNDEIGALDFIMLSMSLFRFG